MSCIRASQKDTQSTKTNYTIKINGKIVSHATKSEHELKYTKKHFYHCAIEIAQRLDPKVIDFLRQTVNSLLKNRYKTLARKKITIKTNSINTPLPIERNVALFGLNWLDIGGAERFAIDAIRIAHDMGYKVTVICDQPGPQRWLPRVYELVEKIELIGEMEPNDKERLLLDLVQNIKPELIHIHHCGTLYKILPQLRASGYSGVIIDTTHILENRTGGFVTQAIKYTEHINHHHVISDTLNDILQTNGILKSKVFTGYLFSPAAAHTRIKRFEATKPTKIGFVGRFVQQKRPYLYVELASRLDPNHFSFHMLGDGPLLGDVKKYAKRKGVSITHKYPPTDADQFLREIDILVICSDIEGLTLVAFEAINNDCLVISTDVGAQNEVICPPFLMPVDPYAFTNNAKSILNEIRTGTIDFNESIKNQKKSLRNLLLKPQATEICAEAYRGNITKGLPDEKLLLGLSPCNTEITTDTPCQSTR